MTTLIVRRRKEEELWTEHPRKLVYGRRKTGKSFFVRNFTEYDAYFHILSDGSIKLGRETVSYDVLVDRIRRGEHVVVDEFHRLKRRFLDFIHTEQPENLVLVTSTRFRAKELMGGGSPILGLFQPLPFSIISPLDILRSLREHFSGKELIERSVYYREPILLTYGSTPLLKTLRLSIREVPYLVSEIFNEEDRKLTEVYSAVMHAIAGSTASFGKLSSYVMGKVDIDRMSLTYHLRLLQEMDIVRTIPIYQQRIKFYRHSSPFFDLYYYLDKKYGVSEFDIPSSEVLAERIPHHVEWFIEDFFSELYNLRPVKILRPEIDIALTRFKRLVLLGEVKWKERVSEREVREVEEKFYEVERRYGEVERKVIVVPEGSGVPETELEVWDVERMVREVG